MAEIRIQKYNEHLLCYLSTRKRVHLFFFRHPGVAKVQRLFLRVRQSDSGLVSDESPHVLQPHPDKLRVRVHVPRRLPPQHPYRAVSSTQFSGRVSECP